MYTSSNKKTTTTKQKKKKKKKKKVSRCVHKQTLVDLNKILYISRVYNSKQYTQHHFSSISSVPGISYKTNSAMTAVKQTRQRITWSIESNAPETVQQEQSESPALSTVTGAGIEAVTTVSVARRPCCDHKRAGVDDPVRPCRGEQYYWQVHLTARCLTIKAKYWTK